MTTLGSDGSVRLEHLDFAAAGQHFDMFTMRSEDVRFSPSGTRLAVVTTQNKILLYAVDLLQRPLQVEFLTMLVSRDLRAPHGVDWISDDTLVVANRAADLAFFAVPRRNQWEPQTSIRTLSRQHSRWFGAPGEMRDIGVRRIMTGACSVRTHGQYIYVGCNKANTITRHRILPGPSCDQGELVARRGIDIPDSAAVSPDGAWLAVADHNHGRVLIFRLGYPNPCGELKDTRLIHPHGVVFDRTGELLICTDAGGRGVFAFHAPKGTWAARRSEANAYIEGVEQDVFERVQSETPEIVRALEGGSKGVDISRDGRVVVTTCRGQTLRFFHLHAS